MKCPGYTTEMTRTQIKVGLIRNGYGGQHVPGWRCPVCGRLSVLNYNRATCRCGEPVGEHSYEWLADRFRPWVLGHNRDRHAVPGNLRT